MSAIIEGYELVISWLNEMARVVNAQVDMVFMDDTFEEHLRGAYAQPFDYLSANVESRD